MKKTIIPIILCLIAVIVFAAGVVIQVVHAGPSQEVVYATATATSTRTYLTPGTGTTTLNAFSTSAFQTDENIDQIDLNIAFTASSTTSHLRWHYEYSNDGNDWFLDDIGRIQYLSATSTTQWAAPILNEYDWQYASTSLTSNLGLKHISVPNMNTKYFRIVFYVPQSSSNGAVWAQAVAKSLPGSN